MEGFKGPRRPFLEVMILTVTFISLAGAIAAPFCRQWSLAAELLLVGVIGLEGAAAFQHLRVSARSEYCLKLADWLQEHNWRTLENKVSTGLTNDQQIEVDVMCYQHMNLLFLAWLYEDVMPAAWVNGWQNFGRMIAEGWGSRPEFKERYRRIFAIRDVYPVEFLDWLRKLGMNPAEP